MPTLTGRGEEACECARQADIRHFVVGRTLTKPARLRTETSYKAGSVRRGSQASQSRAQSTVQVNGEFAQGKFTFLSGESWNPGPGVGFMPKAGVVL